MGPRLLTDWETTPGLASSELPSPGQNAVMNYFCSPTHSTPKLPPLKNFFSPDKALSSFPNGPWPGGDHFSLPSSPISVDGLQSPPSLDGGTSRNSSVSVSPGVPVDFPSMRTTLPAAFNTAVSYGISHFTGASFDKPVHDFNDILAAYPYQTCTSCPKPHVYETAVSQNVPGESVAGHLKRFHDNPEGDPLHRNTSPLTVVEIKEEPTTPKFGDCLEKRGNFLSLEEEKERSTTPMAAPNLNSNLKHNRHQSKPRVFKCWVADCPKYSLATAQLRKLHYEKSHPQSILPCSFPHCNSQGFFRAGDRAKHVSRKHPGIEVKEEMTEVILKPRDIASGSRNIGKSNFESFQSTIKVHDLEDTVDQSIVLSEPCGIGSFRVSESRMIPNSSPSELSDTDLSWSDDTSEWDSQDDQYEVDHVAVHCRAAQIDEPPRLLMLSALQSTRKTLLNTLMGEFLNILNEEWSADIQRRGDKAPDSKESSAFSASNSSDSQTGYPNSKKRKQGREAVEEESPDDDDEKDPKRHKKDSDLPSDETTDVLFACPYRKHDPSKYNSQNLTWRTCATSPFRDINRVKGHLFRKHRIFQCGRCKEGFASKEDLDLHFLATEGCPVNPTKSEEDGITPALLEKLKSRKKAHPNQSSEDRWRGIYQTLFPSDITPSPYFDPMENDLLASLSSKESSYEEYSRQELPRVFRNALEAAITEEAEPILERLRDQLVSMIRDCQDQVFSAYKSSQSSVSYPSDNICPPSPKEDSHVTAEREAERSNSTSIFGTAEFSFDQPRKSNSNPSRPAIQSEQSNNSWLSTGQLTPTSSTRAYRPRESSLSSLESAGPASPYTANTSNPKIAGDIYPDFQDFQSIPLAPIFTPSQDNFSSYYPPANLDYSFYETGHDKSSTNVRNSGIDLIPIPGLNTPFGIHVTSHSLNGESQKESEKRKGYATMPKLDRTMTGLFEDELYNPRFQIPSFLPPKTPLAAPVSLQNDIFSQRLQTTNSQQLNLPSLQSTRSPFRQGSPLAPSAHFGTASYMRERQITLDEALALQGQRREIPKSVSPQDVDLIYHENEEDSQMPLFPSSSLRRPSTSNQE